MQFVYVKVPLLPGMADRLPTLRGEIEQALASQGVGELLGWGASQGGAGPAYHRLDIEVSELDRGVQVLRAALARLAAPAGTELHYTHNGRALQTLYGEGGWAPPTPSTATSRSQPSVRSLGRAR